jgi:hypothetical protein
MLNKAQAEVTESQAGKQAGMGQRWNAGSC